MTFKAQGLSLSDGFLGESPNFSQYDIDNGRVVFSTESAELKAWNTSASLSAGGQPLAGGNYANPVISGSGGGGGYLQTLKELENAPTSDGKVVNVAKFFANSPSGSGGTFIYSSSISKSLHNGVTVIDPDRVSAWDGTKGDLSTLFTAGSGSGAFVRIDGQDITPEMAGALGNPNDDTLSLKQAILVCSSENKYLEGRFKTFVSNEELEISSNSKIRNIEIDFSSSVDSNGISTSGGSFGPEQSVTADITKDDKSISVPSSAFSPGDWVFVKSASNFWYSTTPVTEIIQIKDIPDSNTINMYGGLLHNYLVSDNTTVSKLNLLTGIKLYDVKIKGNGSSTLNGLNIDFCLNPELINVKIDRFDARSAFISNTVGHYVKNLTGDNCEVPGVSYSLVLSNVKNGRINNAKGKNVRHVVTYGGSVGVSAGDVIFNVFGDAMRAAVFDTHPQARDITCVGVTMQNPNMEAGENIVTTQGVNISVTEIHGDIGSVDSNGVLIQPLVEYQESGYYLIHSGSVRNCDIGVLVDKPKANVNRIIVGVDVENPASTGILAQTDGFDINHLSIKSSITGVASASNECVRLRHLSASGSIKSSKLDLLSTRDNTSNSNIILLGVSGNLIGNCSISGVLTNGTYGVRGVSAEIGAININGVVFSGMATSDTTGI